MVNKERKKKGKTKKQENRVHHLQMTSGSLLLLLLEAGVLGAFVGSSLTTKPLSGMIIRISFRRFHTI